MKLEELKESKDVFVNADDIADILQTDAQSIRSQAKSDPSKLGFHVIVIGSRVKIPRKPFLSWIGE